MKKISFWRIIASGAVFAVVDIILNSIGAWLTMPYYMMQDYFPVWSKLMMPTAGPPPTAFYYYAIGFSFLSGALFALVYTVIRNGLHIRQLLLKGVFYGFLVYIVGAIPGFLSMLLLINLPLGLLVFWAGQSLVTYIINGAIVAAINR
jgi:hypothetical protein